VSSEDDNSRTDEYWMGVRDALRMVDSFHKWANRNPGRAKSLEDFIHDGLIAAAKRCESCLSDKLGLSFIEDETDEEKITVEDAVELEDERDDDDEEEEIISGESIEIDDALEESEPTPSFVEPIGHVEPATDIPFEVPDESTISLDNVERKEDESMEDLSIEGPPREFSTDFDLVEPTTLIVDETSIPEAPTMIEPEPEPEEVLDEEIETDSEPESEELPDRPSFTWSEYEKAVTPSSEPEPLDSDVDILPSEDEEVSVEMDDEVTEEPPEPPKEWSPSSEPSIEEEESEIETEPEIDESKFEVEGEDEPVISEPPPPPPPPESEEDEEERKRRARRLFFGA